MERERAALHKEGSEKCIHNFLQRCILFTDSCHQLWVKMHNIWRLQAIRIVGHGNILIMSCLALSINVQIHTRQDFHVFRPAV